MPDISIARAYQLGEMEVDDIADTIVKAYKDKQDNSDGSAMFNGELRNLIIRALTEAE